MLTYLINNFFCWPAIFLEISFHSLFFCYQGKWFSFFPTYTLILVLNEIKLNFVPNRKKMYQDKQRHRSLQKKNDFFFIFNVEYLKIGGFISFQLNTETFERVKRYSIQPMLRDKYVKPNTMLLRKVSQCFTQKSPLLPKIKAKLDHYRLFGNREVRHNYPTRFNRNSRLTIPLFRGFK